MTRLYILIHFYGRYACCLNNWNWLIETEGLKLTKWNWLTETDWLKLTVWNWQLHTEMERLKRTDWKWLTETNWLKLINWNGLTDTRVKAVDLWSCFYLQFSFPREQTTGPRCQNNGPIYITVLDPITKYWSLENKNCFLRNDYVLDMDDPSKLVWNFCLRLIHKGYRRKWKPPAGSPDIYVHFLKFQKIPKKYFECFTFKLNYHRVLILLFV